MDQARLQVAAACELWDVLALGRVLGGSQEGRGVREASNTGKGLGSTLVGLSGAKPGAACC